MTENTLAELKARADKARQDQTRAEIERDNAREAREKAIQELKAEFNVDTPESGAILLKELNSQYQEMKEELEKALDAIA